MTANKWNSKEVLIFPPREAKGEQQTRQPDSRLCTRETRCTSQRLFRQSNELMHRLLIALHWKSGINDQRVIQFCKHFNISLSRMQLRALKIPNSLSSLSTVAWMNYYFKLVAESPPNASEELHLEPVKKKDIYEEYCFDVQTYGDLNEPIRLELFLDIWPVSLIT
jgi:hypothetical protein